MFVAFQVMMETALVTGCKEYKEAWAKLLPAMWPCVETHFPDVLEEYTEEELAEIEDGNAARLYNGFTIISYTEGLQSTVTLRTPRFFGRSLL